MASITSNFSLSNVCGTYIDNGTLLSPAGIVIEDYVANCLELESFRALRILVPNSSLLPSLYQVTSTFESLYKVPVVLNAVDVGVLGSEILQQLTLQDFSDAWVVDPSITGDLVGRGALADLTGYVFEDPAIDWSDVTMFFRKVAAIFDDEIIGVPLDGDQMLMYYRRDLFATHNLTVPLTWDEVVDIAVRMNGTDTDGDGEGDVYGVCIDTSPTVCKALFILTAILAPYVQYNGTQQGIYIDPATMTPLLDNEAMARAVQHYMTLFRYSPYLASCQTVNEHFTGGTCLMTVDFGDEFKANAQIGGTTNRTASALGVSRLPGSAQVLNRTTGRLMTCTGTDMCPYAEQVVLANGSTAWVNFAPYSAFGGWTGMVNARAEPAYQKLAYQFFSLAVQPNNSLQAVLDPTSGLDPYRLSQLSLLPENLDNWFDAGYDEQATISYLATVNQALASPNVVLDVRLQYLSQPVRSATLGIALNTTVLRPYLPNLTVGDVTAAAQAAVVAAMRDLDLVALQRQYCRLLGCNYGRSRPDVGNVKAVSASSGSAKRFSGAMIVLLAVLVPLGALLLGALVGLMLWRRVLGHRNLLRGVVRAPMAGPQTSLLITDIQDSTSLWEALPEDVMDAALRTHHAVVRKALSKHNGYESATEGDSFILAFHTAAEAVACALRIQTQLLAASWHQQLLRCATCDSAGEVWMVPTRGAHYTALRELLGGTASEPGNGTESERCLQRYRNPAGGGKGLRAYRLGTFGRDHHSAKTPPDNGAKGASGNVLSTVQLPQPPSRGLGGAKPWSLWRFHPRRHGTGSGDATRGGLQGISALGEATAASAAPGLHSSGPFFGSSSYMGSNGDSILGAKLQEGQSQGQVSQFVRLSTTSAAGDEDWAPDSHGHTSSQQAYAAASTAILRVGSRDEPSSNAKRIRGAGVLRCAGAGLWGLAGCWPRGDAALGDRVPDSGPVGEEQAEHQGVTLASLQGFPSTVTGMTNGMTVGSATAAQSGRGSQLLRDWVRAAWITAVGAAGQPTPPPAFGRPIATPRMTEVDGGTEAADQAACLNPPVEPLSWGSSERRTGTGGEAVGAAGGVGPGGGGHVVNLSGTASPQQSPPASPFGDAVAAGPGNLSSSPMRLGSAMEVAHPGRKRKVLGPIGGGAAVTTIATASVSAPSPRRTDIVLEDDLLEAFNGVRDGRATPMKGQHQQQPNGGLASLALLTAHGNQLNHQQRPALSTQVTLSTGPSGLGAAMGAEDAGTGGGASGLRSVCSVHQSALRQLAFRGLRVRMGIHSGVATNADVLYNQAEARYHYSGAGMALARGVQGAAAGGQVLLSDATFALIRNALAGKRLRGAYVVLHMGEHLLDAKLADSQQLYQALPRQLLCRLPLLPPVKVVRTISAGVLEAPLGCVAVAFLTAVGTATLQAWNSEVTRRSLAIFQDTFAAEAAEHAASGAYIVEATGGLLLAAFASASDALVTCRALQQSLLLADWPAELLEHEMCEQVSTVLPHGDGTIVRELLFRGLRVKGGVDWGSTRGALNGATGRIAYRGRVMNRAARISSQASSGQLLCSRAAWQAAGEADGAGGVVARGLTALSLGSVLLKGVSESIEILEVRAAVSAASAAVLGGLALGTGSFMAQASLATNAPAAATAAPGAIATVPFRVPLPAAAAASAPATLPSNGTGTASTGGTAGAGGLAAGAVVHAGALGEQGDGGGGQEPRGHVVQHEGAAAEGFAADGLAAEAVAVAPTRQSAGLSQVPISDEAAPIMSGRSRYPLSAACPASSPFSAAAPAAGMAGAGAPSQVAPDGASDHGCATSNGLLPGGMEGAPPPVVASLRAPGVSPAHVQVFRLDAATGIAAPEPPPPSLSPAGSLLMSLTAVSMSLHGEQHSARRSRLDDLQPPRTAQEGVLAAGMVEATRAS